MILIVIWYHIALIEQIPDIDLTSKKIFDLRNSESQFPPSKKDLYYSVYFLFVSNLIYNLL